MKKRNNVFDLNGLWKFMPDKDDRGGEKGYMLASCDTSFWREAQIPCTFEGAAQECTGYRGTVWFRRTFSLYETQAALIWLEFAAVNYRADVWINEQPVGSHVGGYLPFRFEISKYFKTGENLLCVRVNNRIIPGMLPPSHFWRGHGGIIRGVSLYSTPACYINTVKAVKTDTCLKMVTEVVNRAETAKTVRIRHTCPKNGLSAQTSVSVPPMSEAAAEAAFPLDAFELWEPESPAMYICKTVMTAENTADAYDISFGVRDICVKDGKILLNGKELRLRGFDRHEDSPAKMNAADIENSERDFRMMKQMGANFVRFCHYPHSEEELDICDRLGLTVLAELPLNAPMVAIKEYNESETRRALPQMFLNAKTAAKEMIERDFNHPCVIFWSVSNESNEGVPEIRLMNDALIRYIKRLDGSRLVTHVTQGCWWYDKELVPSLFTYDDVICINAYITTDHNSITGSGDITPEHDLHAAAFWDEKMAIFREKFPGKPVVVTEFGYPTGKLADGIKDEEKQRDALLCDMRAMEKRLAGYAIWHFADHEWERAEDGTVFFGSNISPYGVFTRDRKPKKCVGAIAEYWKENSAAAQTENQN